MVLTGVVPEMFAYGFIATVFSHSPYLGPALAHFLFYGIIFYAVHRCDVDDGFDGMFPDGTDALLLDGLTLQVAGVWLGVFVGLAYVFALDTPRLLSLEIFYSQPHATRKMGGNVAISERPKTEGGGESGLPWNAKPYVWNWLIVLAGMAIGIAIYFYEHRFTTGCVNVPGGPEPWLSTSFQTGVAIGLTVFAAILLITYLVALLYAELRTQKSGQEDAVSRRLPDGHIHSGILNFKYLIYFALLYSLPAAYDFLDLSPFARYGVQIGLLALVLFIMFITGANYGSSFTGDRYLGTVSAWRVAAALFMFFVTYSTVYLSAPLTDTGNTLDGSDPSVVNAVWWATLISGIWIVLYLIVGIVLSATNIRDAQNRKVDTSDYYPPSLADARASLLSDTRFPQKLWTAVPERRYELRQRTTGKQQ